MAVQIHVCVLFLKFSAFPKYSFQLSMFLLAIYNSKKLTQNENFSFTSG